MISHLRVNKNSGFTLIEVIVVLALIGILSTLISVYVVDSSKFGSNIKKDYNEVSEARIAMSYVTNLIQQNDVSNAISVDSGDVLKPILKVKKDSNLEKTVEIYYDDTQKKLMEKIDDKTNCIANISGFNIEYVDTNKAESSDDKTGSEETNKTEAEKTEDKVDKKKSTSLNSIVITVKYKDVYNKDTIKSLVQDISLRATNFTVGGES